MKVDDREQRAEYFALQSGRLLYLYRTWHQLFDRTNTALMSAMQDRAPDLFGMFERLLISEITIGFCRATESGNSRFSIRNLLKHLDKPAGTVPELIVIIRWIAELDLDKHGDLRTLKTARDEIFAHSSWESLNTRYDLRSTFTRLGSLIDQLDRHAKHILKYVTSNPDMIYVPTTQSPAREARLLLGLDE